MKLLAILNKLFTPIFVGKLYQTPIFIHWSWLWVLLLITPISPTTSLLICSIFIIHVLHELGHNISYKFYKIQPSKITIYLTGGLTHVPKYCFDGKSRIITALSGPLVNILLIPFLYRFEGAFFDNLVFLNYCVIFLNILPAFPLDVGLIFRYFSKNKKYFRISSEVLVSLIGVIGIFRNNLLLIILSLLLYYVIQEEKSLQ